MAFSVKSLANSAIQGRLEDSKVRPDAKSRLKQAINKVKTKVLGHARAKMAALAFRNGLATTISRGLEDLQGLSGRVGNLTRALEVLQKLSTQEQAQRPVPLPMLEDALLPDCPPPELEVPSLIVEVTITQEEQKIIREVSDNLGSYMDGLLRKVVKNKQESGQKKVERIALVITGMGKLLREAQVVAKTVKRSRNTATPNSMKPLPPLSSSYIRKEFSWRSRSSMSSSSSDVTPVSSSLTPVSSDSPTPLSEGRLSALTIRPRSVTPMKNSSRPGSAIDRLSPRLAQFSISSAGKRGALKSPLMGSFVRLPEAIPAQMVEGSMWEKLPLPGRDITDSEGVRVFAPTPHNTPQKPKVGKTGVIANLANFVGGDVNPKSNRLSSSSPTKSSKRKYGR